MRSFVRGRKLFYGQIIFLTILLIGSTGGGSSVFADEWGKGYGKHRRSPVSSSFKLSTTTGLVRALAVRDYINHELISIQEQAARGQGPQLVALASMLEEPDSEALSHWIQTHYHVLFANLDQPEDLLIRVRSYRNNHPI